jgi:hypothetical protein
VKSGERERRKRELKKKEKDNRKAKSALSEAGQQCRVPDQTLIYSPNRNSGSLL